MYDIYIHSTICILPLPLTLHMRLYLIAFIAKLLAMPNKQVQAGNGECHECAVFVFPNQHSYHRVIWLVVQPINTPQNVTHPRASPIHGNRGMQSKSSQQCEPVHIQPRKMKTHHAKQVVIDKGISLNKSILRVISYDMLYIISYIICMIYCRLYGYRLSCR